MGIIMENNQEALVPEVILRTLPSTKQQIQMFSNNLLEMVDNGEVDPLQIYVQLKSFEKVFKTMNENERFKALVRDSAELHGKDFERFGANLKLTETGVKYDYSECGHTAYNELTAKAEKLKIEMKYIEDTLKVLKGPTILKINDKDVTVNPPKKSSTSSVNVSFK